MSPSIASTLVLLVMATSSTALADAPDVTGPDDGTAAYNFHTGLIEISALSPVVNVFVESASGGLTPGTHDSAPDGLFVRDNGNQVGLLGFTGITATNWKSQNTPGLPLDDLTLIVEPFFLHGGDLSYKCNTSNFVCVPEPSSATLLSLAFAGMAAAVSPTPIILRRWNCPPYLTACYPRQRADPEC